MDRWKLVSDVIMSGVQSLVVKSDQEVSIAGVKNSLMRELRCVKGWQSSQKSHTWVGLQPML